MRPTVSARDILGPHSDERTAAGAVNAAGSDDLYDALEVRRRIT
jgi:hypothetical protein